MGADFFAPAQLNYAGDNKACMHCIQTQAEFHCTICDTDQHKTNFEEAVRSLTAGIVCRKCQLSVAEKKWAKGWFTCKGC
eukprot:186970-Amphidinium_carterae.1